MKANQDFLNLVVDSQVGSFGPCYVDRRMMFDEMKKAKELRGSEM